MDAEGCTNDMCHTQAESFWHVVDQPRDLNPRTREGEGPKLVNVFLSGGAPWGFTLRGGLEHREPLIITKVEEGSKAAAVSLQVGDELVNINEIPLSGYRQEAICLVKSSHKTLSMVVKRRNEPMSRPHSWHSTKFNESQPETGKTQSPPTAAWHARYDASSSTTDLSSSWEQTNLCRVSDQFSSLGSMDSLGQSTNSMEHLGGGKRDSAYSSFSTSSGTPDYTLSKSNAASTENVLHKVSQWDAGGKHGAGRSSLSLAAEGAKQDDKLTYFQMPGVGSGPDGLQTEDPAGCRHSTSSRTSYGPVWNVPEKKKTPSPSPPPPPPARSNSFAATKAHERGLGLAHTEALESHSACKPPADGRRSHNISPKSDGENGYSWSDKTGHKQFSSNKQYSLSSSDVCQAPPPQASHQRHHSDKSTFYPQPWTPSVPKPPNVGGYYSSLQDLPTNGSTQVLSQNQRWNLNPSLSSTTSDQNSEGVGPTRYYCVTTCQPTQPGSLSLSGIPENRRSMTGSDLAPIGNERESIGPQMVSKVKYPPQHPSHAKDTNPYGKHQVTPPPDSCVSKPSSDDRGGTHLTEPQYIGNPSIRPSEPRRSLPAQLRDLPQNVRQQSTSISPQATPMLHSLSIYATGQEEKTGGAKPEESLESGQMKRTDRFATTLRNEIQMRRAKLQKSKSTASLPGAEDETGQARDLWKSDEISTPTSADGSFSNTYKDHLKEAQARVLKATSFRRRDLEPVLMEHATPEATATYPSSAHTRKDVSPLPTVAESATSSSGTPCGQVARVGGRKRFPVGKKVRCFSEPDKIHEVGVDEVPALAEDASSSLDQPPPLKAGVKPGFPSHIPLQNQKRDLGSGDAADDTTGGIQNRNRTEKVRAVPSSAQSLQDQQRLGTFAEYEARWNNQRNPPEKKPSGRYHSADNILDPGPEDKAKSNCFHERSRSSPSTDIYGQKIPVPTRRSETGYSQMESKPTERLRTDTRFLDSGPGYCDVRETPAQFENDPVPLLAPPTAGANPDWSAALGPADPGNHSHAEQSSGPGTNPPAVDTPAPGTCPQGDYRQPSSSNRSDVFSRGSSDVEPNSALFHTHSAKRGPELGKGPADKGQGAVHHLSKPSPRPASSPPASSHRAAGLPGMEEKRSLSPQFSPQRLSDKPPASCQDEEDPNRMELWTENEKAAGRKVPIRIVHSEEKESSSSSSKQCELRPSGAEGYGLSRIGGLGATGQDSVFSAFTRPREPDSGPDARTQEPQVASAEPAQPADESAEATGPAEEEDQKREELARDIMGKDKSLADILDQSKMKTTMDLMEGIFPQGEQLLEEAHQRRKAHSKPPNPRPAEEREKEDDVAAAAVTVVTSSTYYSTSAPKAELLIKMKDMQEQHEEEEEDSEDELDPDLANKKQELIDSLSKKLQVLREARESLQEDILDNSALGDEVEAQVQQVCKPNELDKFRMFVGDLDKVVSLLLSLSGRLARVENALNSLEEDATPEERRTLIEKRKLLIRQHEDAKELKENLDRRERVVYDILASQLQEESLTDYEHFVKMKSALIIEQRKLEDKIKLGEEQLKCLTDSLPLDQRLAF